MSLPSTASIKTPIKFSAKDDARLLHRLLKSKFTADQVAEIIVPRTFNQRTQIKNAYENEFGDELISSICKSKNDTENLIFLLFKGPINTAAREMHKKIDKDILDETICCYNNDELNDLKDAYRYFSESSPNSKYVELIDAINDSTKGTYNTYLVHLLNKSRPEISNDIMQNTYNKYKTLDTLVDENLVRKDIGFVRSQCIPKTKPDELELVEIFSKRTNLHLCSIYLTYKNMYGTSVVEDISKYVSKPLRNAINTSIMNALDNKLLTIAQLYESMKGLGTRETTLSRIIGTRAEVDLEHLKVLYEERIGVNLIDRVSSDTGGDYKVYLKALLGNFGK
uniref:Annexin A13 n=1 Tax=Lepeophtheirus salmonis TaxID=72036 RepID=D3PI40_LEPSM|nr:Annexin A13 [Lepeophtheirus salmonis]